MQQGGDPGDADRDEWLARSVLAGAETAGIGVVLLTADDGLKTEYASGAAARMLGRDLQSAIALSPLELVAERDRTRLAGIAAEFIETGVFPSAFATRLARGDGTEVSVEMSAGATAVAGHHGLVALVSDVTQQKLALESLEKSEERFRSVVESIPEAIFLTEGTTVTYQNRAFGELFGVRRPGEPNDLATLVRAEDVTRLLEQQSSLTEGQVSRAEYLLPRGPDRTTVEFAAIGLSLDGSSAGLWLARDVTQRRKVEAQMLQADRLAVLGTLAGGMAHAINNPLSYTLLNLEHVSRRMRHLATDDDYYAEARVRLAEAHDGAERVAKIVRQMRSLSRTRHSAPGPVDVRRVVENVLAMIGNEIRYRGQLVTRYDPAPRVWARDGELEQAFLGLLLYVARAHTDRTPQGREIRVTIGRSAEGGALVTVANDGLSLAEDANAHLLDPFADDDSMGLGLVMCSSVLASMDGRLDVSSTRTGTTFRVQFPLQAEDEEHPSIHPTSAPPASRGAPAARRARVLVIDDDPGVARTLRAMLEAEHEVTSVESAREGLRLLVSGADFDIVFCDLVMPEISGMALYQALELSRPQLLGRIVFMTGAVFTPEAERFLSSVPNPRIEKPFSLARIEQLLAQSVRPRTSRPAEG